MSVFKTQVQLTLEHPLTLGSFIKQSINARREKALAKDTFLVGLGVPLKKRSEIATTFSIPVPSQRKKISVERPSVSTVNRRPDPSLADSQYRDILYTIADVGAKYERMPSTYLGKDEEALRDLILVFLESHFEGSATGETFNKSGKTDILLRYKGTNVFIAECKFWHGARAYLQTISQLLRYLTWRDSKAAVVAFVQNRDFSKVLEQIQTLTQTHANFVSFGEQSGPAWFNCRFHLNGDKNSFLSLAVLLFHFPPPDTVPVGDEAL